MRRAPRFPFPHTAHWLPVQVAELLGFDPALVMAELARLQAAEEAEQQEQQPAAGDEGSS